MSRFEILNNQAEKVFVRLARREFKNSYSAPTTDRDALKILKF